MRAWLVLAALVVAAGCTEHEVTSGPLGGSAVVEHDYGAGPTRTVDMLFVIDNSLSMADKQRGLGEAFPRLIETLDALRPLDWRIGITTTDLGGFGYAIPACRLHGDAGVLLEGDSRSCAGYPGRWLVQDASGQSNAVGGDVAGSFACMAMVGVEGCGFEMPMGAARLALDDNPKNAGFLRPGSLLVVVIVTDEDDCSAADPIFLDPLDRTLGPVSSFRCTAAGVECDDPADITVAGPHTGCRPGGHYEQTPQGFVGFLRNLRPGLEDKVVLAVIAGPPEPFVVTGTSAGSAILEPSCRSPFGAADPAVRLSAAVAAMGDGGVFVPICAGDFRPALAAIGDKIAGALGTRCLELPPAHPEHPECAVVVDGEPVPRCSDTVTVGCWAVRPTAACASGYEFDIPAGGKIEAECVVQR